MVLHPMPEGVLQVLRLTEVVVAQRVTQAMVVTEVLVGTLEQTDWQVQVGARAVVLGVPIQLRLAVVEG